MAHCLSDRKFGYYRHARLGEDFVTAPMLSNALGLVVGSWLVACWRRLDCPREVMLVEAGAGGGELLSDVLSVARAAGSEKIDALLDALAVHVVDINEEGRERLTRLVSRFGLQELRFHETLEEVPHGRWFFLANEFFDALPIRQYLWSGGRSFVRRIALDERRGGAALRFVRGEPCFLPKGFAEDEPVPSEEERIVEVSPRALFLAASVARVLAENGGAAFVCDYGYLAQRFAPRAGSLQAFYRHKAVDPLTHIGACDLSAEVDFDALQKTFAAGLGERGECRIHTQGAFLRAADIADKSSSEGAQRVVRRLTDDKAMGEKFKVLTAFAPQPR